METKEKQLDKIRKRKSYQRFAEWLDFLLMRPTPKAILYKLDEEINSRGGYGSATSAVYAEESLKLLIKDRKVK